LQQFKQVELTGSTKTLRERLVKKTGLLQKADEALMAVHKMTVETGDGAHAVASLVRRGQAYRAMATAVRDMPAPKSLTDEQQKIYRTELERKSEPIATKAAESFRLALENAEKYSYRGSWCDLARDQLQAMSPTAEPGKASPEPAPGQASKNPDP